MSDFRLYAGAMDADEVVALYRGAATVDAGADAVVSGARAVLKGAAKSILFNGVLSFANCIVFFTLGVALWTFYRSHPQLLDVTMAQNMRSFRSSSATICRPASRASSSRPSRRRR